MEFLLFCVLLVVVFFLSQVTTKFISRFFMNIFHSQATTIHILAFLFLPGVILHELSHLLVANLLFVPTGEIEFFPEIHGNQVKMGSVAIAHTDPLRRFVIGVAPVIGGIGVILLLSSYFSGILLSWQNVIILYIIFEIANTMFSSSKDMEGALGFTIGTVLLLGLLQILGLPVIAFCWHFIQQDKVKAFLTRINFSLLIALGIDMFIAVFIPGIFFLFKKR